MAKQKPEHKIIGMDATPEQMEKLVHLGRIMGDPRDDFDREVEEELNQLRMKKKTESDVQFGPSPESMGPQPPLGGKKGTGGGKPPSQGTPTAIGEKVVEPPSPEGGF